ncbi:MAG: MBL fold metallo-hydrolase [Ruminococcaceae bacterium]|nr:MBL fold metallo-hydrolase [Oscillospiraceae bacterium]
MKIHFIGTCSGTEPMPDMHHCSVVFEINRVYYWFDAGENCSHTAMTKMGIDLSRVRCVFISHSHIDHIGGLANLLYSLNKLVWRNIPHTDNDGVVNFFLPDENIFSSVMAVAFMGRKSFPLTMNDYPVKDGVVYEDENVKITALHTTHLKEDGSNGWHAYSYLIEAEGKRVLFSGDVGVPSDLDALIGDGVDILIMETGHHKVADVLDYMESKSINKLMFNHHGREIIGDRDAAEALIRSRGLNAVICKDCQTEKL